MGTELVLENTQIAEEKKEILVHIRWMIQRDWPEVMAIEQMSFEFPWYEEDFVRCLRGRNRIGMVSECEDRVVGFMIYKIYKTRIHLLNFAVHADFRRRGIGNQMIGELIFKLSAQKIRKIVLEVRETNLAAQLFFRENGFRAVKVLHNYYKDTPEDAYKMKCIYRKEKPKILTPEEISANRISRIAS